MIRAEAVHKRYGLLEVLKGITLEVAPREVMCLLGRPGRASRPSFAASTTSRRSIQVGVRRRVARRVPRNAAVVSTSFANAKSAAGVPRSGWSSSVSTCSRT